MSISYVAQLPLDTGAYGKPTLAILNGITDSSVAQSFGLVAGDELTLQIYPRAKSATLGAPTTTVQLDAGFSIVVTGKVQATPDADELLFNCTGFTEAQDGNGNWYYSAALNLNTDELTAAFADNVMQLAVILVIKITSGSGGPKRYLAPITLFNETYSGTEAAPTPGTPGYLNETESDARYAQLANDLGDLPNAATARGNLGLGTAATHAATDFDAAGTAAAAQAAAEAASIPLSHLDTDGTAEANSDTRVMSQKAVRTYVAANAGGGGGATLPQTLVAFVDASGDDSTGVVGSPTTAAKPFATADAAYSALVTATSDGSPGSLYLGVGSFTITLTDASWVTRIVVHGVGPTASSLTINANGTDGSPATDGLQVDVVSDKTVLLSVFSSGGAGLSDADNGAAGGSVQITNAFVGVVFAAGGTTIGDGTDTGNGGNGGTVELDDCYISPGCSISVAGGSTSSGNTTGTTGAGGTISLRNSNVSGGYLTADSGSGAVPSPAGTINGENSSLGNISMNGNGAGDGTLNANGCSYASIAGAPTQNFNSTYPALF